MTGDDVARIVAEVAERSPFPATLEEAEPSLRHALEQDAKRTGRTVAEVFAEVRTAADSEAVARAEQETVSGAASAIVASIRRAGGGFAVSL